MVVALPASAERAERFSRQRRTTRHCRGGDAGLGSRVQYRENARAMEQTGNRHINVLELEATMFVVQCFTKIEQTYMFTWEWTTR